MTQEDMGGLLPGDDVKSLWPQYEQQVAGGTTHHHTDLHKDVIIKSCATRQQNEILRKQENLEIMISLLREY